MPAGQRAQGRPADEVPSTQYRQVQRCTTLTRRGASIIAGEAGQRALHHVMYHYSMYYGALPAGSGAAGAQRRDRSAVARSRQEKTVCGTSQKRSISPGGRPGMRS